MRFIYFVLIFGIIETSYTQEVIVKQVDGDVEFVIGEKRTIVKDFSTFSKKDGVFILKDKNSQLFIRVDNKLDILTFSEYKNKYPLIDLITYKQDTRKQDEDSFLNKFFNKPMKLAGPPCVYIVDFLCFFEKTQIGTKINSAVNYN